MQTGDDGPLARLMLLWITFVAARPRSVLTVMLGITAVACFFGLGRLGVNTDTSSMIKTEKIFQIEERRHKQEFPQYSDTLLVIVDAATPETADQATSRLVDRLRDDTEMFASVFAPSEDDFFQKYGLLYKSLPEIESTADQIAQAQPFLGRLTRDRSLRGLFGILSEASDSVVDGRKVELGEGLTRVTDVVSAHADGNRLKMSWGQVMTGDEPTPDALRRFVIAQPKVNFNQLLPAGPAIEKIHAIRDELRTELGSDVRARVTGEMALNHEELRSLKEDTTFAMILSSLLVMGALYHAFRSIRLTAYTTLALIIGLLLTASWGGIFIGHLNMISVAFAVLYVGLGVDYAAHFLLRYLDLAPNNSPFEALKVTTREVGVSLVLCAMTTSIGFWSFWPTAYSGVSELGVISGFGMIISLVVTLTILPCLTLISPPKHVAVKPWLPALRAWFADAPRRHGAIIRIVALGAAIVSLALVPSVGFDYNPINLRDPHTESVSTIEELMDSAEAHMWPATVLADSESDARQTIDKLKASPAVERVISIFSFTPEEQEDKLAVLEDVRLMLGPEIMDASVTETAVSDEERVAALRESALKLAGLAEKTSNADDREAALRLKASLEKFLARLDAAAPDARAQSLAALETDLVGTLSVALDQMRKALGASTEVSMADLPPEIRDRWLSPSGVYRIEAQPKINPDTPKKLRAFVADIRALAPHVSGDAVGRLESGEAVIQAFQQAFVTAVLCIVVLLMVIMRSVKDTLMAICPLALAGLFTGAASALLDIPFNFANVIALPLLLGMGVDNGIHIVHRYRTGSIEEGSVLASSAAKGVVYSALTTIFSFASLGMVHHRGVASMGKILTLGILFSLLSSLVILPAILHRRKPEKPKTDQGVNA